MSSVMSKNYCCPSGPFHRHRRGTLRMTDLIELTWLFFFFCFCLRCTTTTVSVGMNRVWHESGGGGDVCGGSGTPAGLVIETMDKKCDTTTRLLYALLFASVFCGQQITAADFGKYSLSKVSRQRLSWSVRVKKKKKKLPFSQSFPADNMHRDANTLR